MEFKRASVYIVPFRTDCKIMRTDATTQWEAEEESHKNGNILLNPLLTFYLNT